MWKQFRVVYNSNDEVGIAYCYYVSFVYEKITGRQDIITYKGSRSHPHHFQGQQVYVNGSTDTFAQIEQQQVNIML